MGYGRRNTLDDEGTSLRREVRGFTSTRSEPEIATRTRKGTGQSVILRKMQLAWTRLCVWSRQASEIDCAHRALTRIARFTVTKAKAMKVDVG
jgi:hypothetical protein